MINDEAPRSVVRLLDRTINDITDILRGIRDADDRRFTNGSIELIQRERNKLNKALEVSDAESVRYALRSVLGLTKGVLDIGASWTFEPNAAKQHFDAAMAEARRLAYGL